MIRLQHEDKEYAIFFLREKVPSNHPKKNEEVAQTTCTLYVGSPGAKTEEMQVISTQVARRNFRDPDKKVTGHKMALGKVLHEVFPLYKPLDIGDEGSNEKKWKEYYKVKDTRELFWNAFLSKTKWGRHRNLEEALEES